MKKKNFPSVSDSPDTGIQKPSAVIQKHLKDFTVKELPSGEVVPVLTYQNFDRLIRLVRGVQ